MEVIYNITEVGSKASYLDFMTSRYETRTLDLQERQVDVEGADPASTIIKYKSQEVAYNAALQMGTKIIQPSIFDFMS
jgi:flagellar hook-associated protein 3 FlgL